MFVLTFVSLLAHLPSVTNELDVGERVVVEQPGAELNQVQSEVAPDKIKHLLVQKIDIFRRKLGGNLIGSHGTAGSPDLSEKVNMIFSRCVIELGLKFEQPYL